MVKISSSLLASPINGGSISLLITDSNLFCLSIEGTIIYITEQIYSSTFNIKYDVHSNEFQKVVIHFLFRVRANCIDHAIQLFSNSSRLF